MKIFLTAVLILIGITAFAQRDSARIALKFKKQPNQTVIFCYGGFAVKNMVLDSTGFYITKVASAPGYYTLIDRGRLLRVYLEQGLKLVVHAKQYKNGTAYSFSGKGRSENAFLAKLANQQAKILPLKGDTLTAKINMVAPADFTAMLDQYKTISMQMLAKHKFGANFNNLVTGCTDFLVRRYALQYLDDYGVDAEKKKQYLANLQNGDPSLDSPQGKQDALNSVYTKALTYNDRKAVFKYVQADLDLNNEALYKSLPEYRTFVDGRIDYLASTGGNHDHSYADRRVDFIKTAISNNYIRQQMLKMYAAQ